MPTRGTERTLSLGPAVPCRLWPLAEGLAIGSLLVDGFAGGTWTTARQEGAAVMTIRPLEPTPDVDREAIAAEGARLLEFLAPGDDRREVTFGRPA